MKNSDALKRVKAVEKDGKSAYFGVWLTKAQLQNLVNTLNTMRNDDGTPVDGIALMVGNGGNHTKTVEAIPYVADPNTAKPLKFNQSGNIVGVLNSFPFQNMNGGGGGGSQQTPPPGAG